MFPTRTARFGVALVTSGSVRLKSKEHATELGPVDPECRCSTCRNYSKSVLHVLFKEGNALAAQLLTKHNVSYMMRLMRTMREVKDDVTHNCTTHVSPLLSQFLHFSFMHFSVHYGRPRGSPALREKLF